MIRHLNHEMTETPKLQLPAAAVTIQRLAVYETKSTFYIVGNDNDNSVFRLLKISRVNPKELNIEHDGKQYCKSEMQSILNAVDGDPKRRVAKTPQLKKLLMAFGLLGFVRFTQGYYMVLITRRRKVAQIGGHIIYKIEDISLTDLSSDKTQSNNSAEENRYIKYFNSLDFSSNFYFCYTLDITRTIQQNMVPVPVDCTNCKDSSCDMCLVGTRCYSDFNEKFVWNMHMLRGGDFINKVAREWLVPLVYGFISQANISVFGKSIYLTLIARRSSKYAGTRFLKRGMNESGEVANEVETEQVVHDASYTNHRFLKLSAYVQLRGSVPAFWHQDTSTMVPKPPIVISRSDPYYSTAAMHFNTLMSQYGSPIYILNLVKGKEKRNHERQLTQALIQTFGYLNQFLPLKHKIKYCGFDMSKYSKTKNKRHNVMEKLEEIAKNTFKNTGFFHNVNIESCPENIREVLDGVGLDKYGNTAKGVYQTGAVRTNCVDCLDRTNTAQFVLGKVALGHQLMVLGVITSPALDDNTPCIHSLEEIYEDHGDTMALQYGGSQLVHRIRGYRKDNPWTSHSYDILNTVSRYYRNAFTDYEKQNAINLFLGMYEVGKSAMSLWDLTSDHYLHHLPRLHSDNPYTAWWDTDVWESLPLASTITSWHKTLNVMTEQYRTLKEIDADLELPLKTVTSHFFDELYRPTMLSSFEEHYCHFMPSTAKEAGLCSPFSQVRPKVLSRSLSVRTKPVSIYLNKPNNTDSDSTSDSEFSEEEESLGVASETAETECSSSPTPRTLPILVIPAPSPLNKELYRQYSSDSTYLQRGLGTFSLPPPSLALSEYRTARTHPAPVADSYISHKTQQLYAKQTHHITVANDTAQLYSKYCSFDTGNLIL